MNTKKSICVFCSAQIVPQEYQDLAKSLGSQIGQQQYNLVWGGSDTGLMQIVSSAAMEYGAEAYGVALELLRDEAKKTATTMEFAKDLGERKDMMLRKSDALVVLPGGIGTFDEFFYILQLKKWKLHLKPIILINFQGFYDGIVAQLNIMEQKDFTHATWDLVHVVSSVDEVFAYLQTQGV